MASAKEFISHAEWDTSEKFDGTEKILRWADAPQDTIFLLEMIEERKDQKFLSYILHFCDRNDLSYRCFAPSHFIKEIRRHRATNAQPFFVSLGTMEHKNHEIAKFNISYKIKEIEWDLFH